MGPKKKVKKDKKSKKEEELVPEEPSEYDTMDVAMLKEAIQTLKQQLEKAQTDRNYVQHERDMIESFYEITKQEIQDYEHEILAKDREMEIMEDNHRVEVRVYVQKVKHLEYEHKNSIKRLQTDGTSRLEKEKDFHVHRETKLRTGKQSLKLELYDIELSHEEEIEQMKQAQENNLVQLRDQLEQNNVKLETRCQEHLQELKEALELRRKVDIHEIEERKNLHINDLMKNHERAFTQIRNYYHDITKDNLRLIDSLKKEMAAMKKKAAENMKLMHEISHENKRLSVPLTAALEEVAQLRQELKDQEKDQLSLQNAKARVVYLTRQIRDVKARQKELSVKYRTMEAERDALYDTFELTVHSIYNKGESKNVMLEHRLASMDDQHVRKEAQVQEMFLAANLDPLEAREVTESLKTGLDSKNAEIRKLQYRLAKESKAYNDSLRTFMDKLAQFGIPEEEIRDLGFELLALNRNGNPAGLVAVE